jgi:hypothetical protein
MDRDRSSEVGGDPAELGRGQGPKDQWRVVPVGIGLRFTRDWLRADLGAVGVGTPSRKLAWISTS